MNSVDVAGQQRKGILDLRVPMHGFQFDAKERAAIHFDKLLSDFPKKCDGGKDLSIVFMFVPNTNYDAFAPKLEEILNFSTFECSGVTV